MKKQIRKYPIIRIVNVVVVVGVPVVVDIARVVTIVIVRRAQPPPATGFFVRLSAYIIAQNNSFFKL